MAVKINKKYFSTELKDKLAKSLTFTPKKWNFGKKIETESLSFYREDTENYYIPLSFAKSIFPNIPYRNYPNTNLEFTGELRENQVQAVNEALKQLQQHQTTTLALPPGFGKTVLGVYIASKIKMLTVILIHRELLITQWRKTLQDKTNASVWVIGETPPAYFDTIICMSQRWNSIDSFIRLAVGLLIIDEAHTFCTPCNVSSLLAFQPKYIVLESASLERDDGMHAMAHALANKHIIYRPINKPFLVYKIITGVIPERIPDRYGNLNYSHVVDTILYNNERNNMIIQLTLANIKYKILILTSRKDHANLLFDELEKNKVSCDYLYGTKKNYVDSNVLIGTTSKIGTGFDQATFCSEYDGRPFDLLLLVTSFRKIAMYIQNIGRMFRSDFATIMHFVDNDQIYENHWNIGKRWYKGCGADVKEFSFCANKTTNSESVINNWVSKRINK